MVGSIGLEKHHVKSLSDLTKINRFFYYKNTQLKFYYLHKDNNLILNFHRYIEVL